MLLILILILPLHILLCLFFTPPPPLHLLLIFILNSYSSLNVNFYVRAQGRDFLHVRPVCHAVSSTWVKTSVPQAGSEHTIRLYTWPNIMLPQMFTLPPTVWVTSKQNHVQVLFKSAVLTAAVMWPRMECNSDHVFQYKEILKRPVVACF
jgi:hypothetical protein